MAKTREKAEEVKAHILAEYPKANVVGIRVLLCGDFVVRVKRRHGACVSNLWIHTKSQWNKLAVSTKELCCRPAYMV